MGPISAKIFHPDSRGRRQGVESHEPVASCTLTSQAAAPTPTSHQPAHASRRSMTSTSSHTGPISAKIFHPDSRGRRQGVESRYEPAASCTLTSQAAAPTPTSHKGSTTSQVLHISQGGGAPGAAAQTWTSQGRGGAIGAAGRLPTSQDLQISLEGGVRCLEVPASGGLSAGILCGLLP
jgi:hypothetical protein